MEPRVKCFTARLTNVGNAELRVSGDLPTIGDVIEFGKGLEAVVVDGDKVKRVYQCQLKNPEIICQE